MTKYVGRNHSTKTKYERANQINAPKAEEYESTDCEKCIEIQKEVIKLLILEVNRSTRLAKAALEVLSRKGEQSL